jgi:hypothetical protein
MQVEGASGTTERRLIRCKINLCVFGIITVFFSHYLFIDSFDLLLDISKVSRFNFCLAQLLTSLWCHCLAWLSLLDQKGCGLITSPLTSLNTESSAYAQIVSSRPSIPLVSSTISSITPEFLSDTRIVTLCNPKSCGSTRKLPSGVIDRD